MTDLCNVPRTLSVCFLTATLSLWTDVGRSGRRTRYGAPVPSRPVARPVARVIAVRQMQDAAAPGGDGASC